MSKKCEFCGSEDFVELESLSPSGDDDGCFVCYECMAEMKENYEQCIEEICYILV